MSYAEVAAKNSYQTPEEAAAPQPPQIQSSETASTSSLVDVDSPSVRVVPSDYSEQSVKTDTQATRQRLEREARENAEKLRAEAELAKKKAAAKARKTDSWIVSKLASLSEQEGSALVVANLAAVVGVSVFVGYKAFGLYERGRLGWQQVGIGAAILGAVGVVEGVFGSYWTRARGKKQ